MTILNHITALFRRKCSIFGVFLYAFLVLALIYSNIFGYWQVRRKGSNAPSNSLKTDLSEVDERESIQSILQTLRQRSKYVQEMCRSDLPQLRPNQAASYSIASALVAVTTRIVNKTSEPIPHKMLRQAYPPVSLTKLLSRNGKFPSFYVVRHPFERIVSAYINKFTNMTHKHDGKYFYDTYVGSMIKDNPKTYINTKLLIPEPSFEQFIDFILASRSDWLDPHWKPIWMLCSVCVYKFEFLIKLENFQGEMEALTTYFKETGVLDPKFLVRVENKEQNGNISKRIIAKHYIQTLPELKIRKLYDIYERDFLYYNYSADEYMTETMGTHNPFVDSIR